MYYSVTVFYNQRREAMMDGYEGGDPIRHIAGPYTMDGDTIAHVASKTFEQFNIGRRAVEAGVRSMSVGDVLFIESPGGGGVWLTINGMGFGMLDEAPRNVEPHIALV